MAVPRLFASLWSKSVVAMVPSAFSATTQRQITGGLEDEIAGQHALRIDRSLPVDRGGEAVIGAEFLAGRGRPSTACGLSR